MNTQSEKNQKYWVTLFKENCRALWRKDFQNLESQEIRTVNQFFNETTLRTLIYEMNLLKKNHRLDGTPEEEYQFFVQDFLSDDSYVEYLFQKYPVLYRIFCSGAEARTEEKGTVLRRLERDREEINQCFFSGRPFASAMKISEGEADFHHGNQSVSSILLDNHCRVVYKPRSLQNEIVFYKFISYLMEQCGADYVRPHIFTRENYGWMEFLEQRECKSVEEVSRYYYRIGIIGFAAYLLSMSDLHYENIIACGEYPMLIDLETVLGFGLQRPRESAADKIQAEILDSVLLSGLMPLKVWGDPGVEISALYGEGGALSPVKMPVAANVGRSDMHITYRPSKMGAGKNLVRLGGEVQDPYRYRGEILRGFCTAGNVAISRRQEVWERLQGFGTCKVRHILRDTQVYLMYRMTSYHPQFLQKEGAREQFFQRLNDGTQGKWEVEAEIYDLLHGDIPYFYFCPGSKSLFHGVRGECPGYFPVSAMERVRQKLQNCDLKRVKCQAELILTALESRRPGGFVEPEVPRNEESLRDMAVDVHSLIEGKQGKESGKIGLVSREEREALLKEMMHFLASRAVYGDRSSAEGKASDLSSCAEAQKLSGSRDVSWFSVNHKVGTQSLRAMDQYLYNGLAGMLLVFGIYQEKTGDYAYRELYDLLCSCMFAYTDRAFGDRKYLQSNQTGAFGGESSILYAYLVLYQILGKPVFLEYARKQSEIVEWLLEKDREYDLIGGNAGAVIVLADMYRVTREEKYLRMAVKGAECLRQAAKEQDGKIFWVSDQVPVPLAGVSHGASGYYWAFLQMYALTKQEKYYETAKKAYLFEEALYDERFGDWMDLRAVSPGDEKAKESFLSSQDGAKSTHGRECKEKPEIREERFSWCHGKGGILMVRKKIAGWLKERDREIVLGKLAAVESSLTELPLSENQSLCHGNIGGRILLSELKGGSGGPQARRMEAAAVSRVRQDLETREQGGVTPLEELGLMDGMAGVVYGIMQELYPEIPNLLFLEV